MVTCALLLAGNASAVTRTWTGAGADNNWTTAANWGGTAPISGDDLVFSGSTRLAPVNNVTAGTTFNSITFSPGAAPFVLSGNSIQLSGGSTAIADNATGGTMSIGLNITFVTAAPTITTASGGLLALGGTISLGTFTLVVNSLGNTQLDGVIGGSGGVSKTGTGNLILSGLNTFSGAVSIGSGVLTLNDLSALGTPASGTTVSSGAALDLNGKNYLTAEPLTLNGTGPGSMGALINSNPTAATFGGLITLGSATSIIGETGQINLSNSGNITGPYALTLGGSAGGSLTGGLATSTGTLMKNDAGTWTLNGSGSYSGATVINLGILKLANASALGTAAGGTSVSSGGALDLNGTSVSLSETLNLNGNGPSGIGALINTSATTASWAGAISLAGNASIIGQTGSIVLGYSGSISGTYSLTLGGAAGGTLAGSWNGAGPLTKVNAGTWTLSGVNTSTGGITISAGTVKLGSSGVIADLCPVTVNGTLDLNGYSEAIGSLAGSGTLDNTSGAGTYTLTAGGDNSSTTFSGIIQNSTGTVAIIKSGTGILTLSGANSFGGTLTVSAGGLRLGAAGVIPDGCAVTIDGTLEMNGFNETMGTLAGGGTIDNNSATTPSTLTTGGLNLQTFFTGIMQNTAQPLSLTKEGSAYFLLTGNNTYSGATTVNGGVLSIGNNGTTGILPGNCVVGSGAAVRFARSDNQTYSGVISGAGQVMKINAGIETLTGANTYTGSTMITGGALEIGNGSASGSITGDVAIAGGGSGSLVFNRSGNITFGGVIYGSDPTGSVVQNGSGTLTLTGANYYTGSTVVNSGTLKLGAAGVIPDSSALVVNGYLDMNGFSETVGSLAGTGFVDNNSASSITLTVGLLNTSTTFSGFIMNTTPTVALTKIGTGTLTLSGANAYSGATTVSQGILRLGASGVVPDAGAVTVNGTLDLNGFSETIGSLAGSGTVDNSTGSGTFTLTTGGNNSSTAFSGTIQNTTAIVALTKAGTGALTLSGSNTFGGAIAVNAGTLKVGSTAALGGIGSGTTVASGAALDLNGVTYSAAEPLTLNGTGISSGGALMNGNATGATFGGSIALGSASSIVGGSGSINLSYGGAITGAYTLTLGGAQGGAFSGTLTGGDLAKQGAGTWTLGSSLTLGSLSLSAGTLNLGSGLAHTLSTTLSISGGGLDFGSSQLAVAAVTVDFSPLATLTAGTGSLVFSGGSAQTFTPKASGTHPNIIVNGAGASVATNGITGGTLTIQAGTLNLGAGHIFTFPGGITATGGGLDFSSSLMQTAGNVDLSGLVTLTAGTGTLGFTSSGAQTFVPKSGAAHPGITHTNSGTLTLSGYNLSCTTFSLSAGTLAFGAQNITTTGNFTVTNGTSTTFSGLGGRTLTVGGTTTWTGTSAANKLNLDPGAAWTLTATGGVSVTFASLANGTASSVAGNCSSCADNGSNLNWNFSTVWDGGGADNNWSTALNWSGDVVPSGTESVSFNSTSTKNATLDASITLKSITFVSGYTGTFAFGANTMTIDGGDADFRSHTSASVTASGGTLIFTGSAGHNFYNRTGMTLKKLVQNGAGGTVFLGPTSLNADTLQILAGSINIGTSAWVHSFGSVLGSAGTLALQSSGFSATGNVDLAGVTVTSGSGNSISFTGTLPQTFAPNAALTNVHINQNGSGGTTVLTNGFTVPSLTLTTGALHLGSGLTHTINTSCFFNGGELDFGSSTLSVKSTSMSFANVSSVTPGTGTLAFTGASGTSFAPKAGLTFPTVEQNSGGTLFIGGTLAAKYLKLTTGSIDLGTSSVTVDSATASTGSLTSNGTLHIMKGNLTLQSTTGNSGNGTFSFEAPSGTQTFTPMSGATYYAVSHSGAGTMRLAANNLTTYFFSQSAGTFDFNGLNLTISSTSGSGLTVTNGTPTTFTGLGGRTLTVNGNATLAGTSGASKLNLDPGTGFTLAVTGTLSASLASIANSNASGSAGTCSECANAGGNTKWNFAVTWDGGGADNNWSTAGNWGSDYVPADSDAVTFNATSVKNCTLDASPNVKSLTLSTAYTGSFDFGSMTLTSAGDVDLRGGTSVSAATGTLRFAGSAAHNLYNHSTTIGTVIQNGTGTTTIQGTTTLTTDNLVLTLGTLNLGSGMGHSIGAISGTAGGLNWNTSAVYASGNVDFTGITVTAATTNSLIFNGGSAQIYKPNVSMPAIRLVQNGNGGTTVQANSFTTTLLTLTLGTLNLGTSLSHTATSLSITGGGLAFGSSTLATPSATVNLSSLSVLTPGTGTLAFVGGSAQSFTPKSGSTHPNIRQYGLGGTTILTNGLTAGSLTLNQGTFNLGAGLSHTFASVNDGGGGPYGNLNFGSSQLHVTGNVTIGNVPTLTPGTGTLAFDGASGTQIFVPVSGGVSHPAITHSGAGTLQLATNNLSCLGFSQSAGTLDFNGRNITTSGSGNLTLTNGTASSLSNLSGRTLTVAGNASFTGTSAGSKLNLNPGAAWTLVVTGTLSGSLALVANNSATVTGGSGVGVCSNCVDGGGNSGWTFATTWVGAGADNNWSTIGNWGANALPTASDAVVFDATSVKSVTLDANASIKSLTLASAYTGTFDFGSATLDIAVGDADFRSGGAINAGTGSLSFSGSIAQKFYPKSGATFPALVQSGAVSTTVTANPIALAGNLTLNSGTFDLGTGFTHTIGAISGSGALDFNTSDLNANGNVDLSTSGVTASNGNTLAFKGASAQSFTPKASLTSLKIKQNGAGTLSLLGNLTTPDLAIASGTLALGAGGLVHTVTAGIAFTGGTLDFSNSVLRIGAATVNFSSLAGLSTSAGGGLEFIGSAPQTFTPAGSAVHPNITQNGVGGTLLIGNLTAGSLSLTTGNLNLGTALSHVFQGSLYSAAGAGLAFSSSTLAIQGQADLSNLTTTTPGTGTLAFTGTGSQTFTTRASTSYPAITHSGSSTLALAANPLVCASFSQSGGALNLGGQDLTTAGAFTISNGTPASLAGLGGRTLTVAGQANLSGGSAGSKLNLNPASAWTLAVTGPLNASFTDLAWSNATASGGVCSDCSDGGNNANWIFSTAWDGGGADGNWTTAGNWGSDVVPSTSDAVVFNATSTKNAVLDADAAVKTVIFQSGFTGSFDFSTHTLSVSADADLRSGGAITGTGTLAFVGTGNHSLTPKGAAMPLNLAVAGTGVTTIQSNGFDGGDLAVSAGASLALGSSRTHTFRNVTGGGALDFGSSTNVNALGNVDLSGLSITSNATDRILFKGGTAQTFTPKAATTALLLVQDGAGGTTLLGDVTTPQWDLNSGVLHLGVGRTHTVTSAFASAGGTLDFGSSILRMQGSTLDLTGLGAITPGTGSLELDRATAMTFYPKLGTTLPDLKKSGAGTVVVASNGIVCGKLDLTAGALDLSANAKSATLTGDLTITGGTLAASGGALTVGGSVALSSGTLDCPVAGNFLVAGGFSQAAGATLNAGSGTLTLNGSATGKLLDITSQLGNLTLNGTGGQWTLTHDLALAGNLSLLAGTLDISANGKTLAVSGGLTQSGGTLTADAGTLNVLGSFAMTGGSFSCPASTPFTVAMDFSHTGGTLAVNAGTITLTSSSTGRTFTSNSALGVVKFQGSGGSWTVVSNPLVADTLSIGAGTLNLGTGSHKVAAFSAAGGGLDFGSSTLEITGNADFSGLSSLNRSTGTLVLSAPSGIQGLTGHGSAALPSVWHTGAGALRLTGLGLVCAALRQQAGSLDLNGFDITVVSGDFDILNGNPSTLASLAGRSIQVTGNAALTGLPAQHLNLAPGAAWTLTVSGLLHVSNADIRNSLAAASAGYADSSLNLGGNVNWIFMDTVKPGNVTGFAATALGGHSITLAWSPSASSDADSVMLRYRTDGIFPTGPADGTLWRSVPKNLTADTATALTDKTIYHFAAFARDSSGNYSLAASAANDTALLPDVTPPANVTAFNAAASGPTTVALGWTGSVSTDADTVMIRYRTDGAFPAGPSDGTLWQVLPNSALNGTVTGLVSNTLYHFGAFVRDSSGNYGPAAVPAQDTALYQAPVLGSVAINDKSGGTADVDPALAFTYSGADSMRFSLLADTATAAWKSLRALDSVAMGGGADGKRIVAAQFKNVFGNRSAWYRDTTLMDRTAPAVNLTLNTDHSWRNWQDAVVGKALDAILGTDSVFVVRKRVADGFYFNGAGWTTVADTARLRVDSAFSVPMPNTAMATGSYDFTAIARDRIGNLSAPLTVRVNYTDNRAPVAAASGIADSVPQNQQVTWTVDLADPDAGDSVLTVASTLPAWMTMTEKADSARGGFAAHRIYTFTGKPLQADVGTATVTIQARDLGNKTFIYTKSFPVIDVNDPPVFASAGPVSAGAKEDSVTRYVPKYSDADEKDPHALAFLQAPAWAVIADSALIFKPGSRDVGTALVRVTISDGRLLDTLDINVDVANVNDAPVAFPSTNWQAQAHWKEDVADSFTVVVVDMDKGDPVAMTSVLPPWIKFTSTTDATEGFNRFFRFTVKPAQTDTGAFPFKLRFQDAAGAASELQFSAKVAAVNDTPTAFVKGVESLAGAARISFDAADEDGNAASTRFHYRLISASGDTVRRGIIASPFLRLHPLADGDYKLAVAAEDEGGLKQVGYTMANLRISGATALTLDSARWNMIGYPGRSLAAGALGAGAALTTWDESSSDGSPLGRYAAGGNADSLYGGKGYWVRVANRVNLNTPLAALLDKPFTMKLTHGKQGWNQIGNPFPYFVDLSASGLTFWEWDANRRDLVNAKGIMKPWGAYWVQVPKDTILTVKDSPYFPAGSGAGAGVLAKSSGLTAPSFRQVSDWSLQLALQAGPYQDQANFLGVRPESRDGLGISSQAVPVSGLLPDAPKFGDYIALHFERPGETTGGNADGDPTGTQSGDPEDLGFAADFREHMGEDEEWWDFSVENSQSGFRTANLSLPGLAGLQAAGLNAFLVRKGEAVPLSAETPAVVSMDGEATHYSLVVTPHADFAERLKGNFSISQNFPNPVQTHTAFRFFLPQTWDASGKREAKAYRLRLNVYDFSGRLAAQVADGSFKPGSHTLVWKPQAKNGGSLAKGAYVYRLEIPGFTKSLKMLVK